MTSTAPHPAPVPAPAPVPVPPGWYADPWGAAAWRWWDGYQWTGYAGGPSAYVLPPARPKYPHDDVSAEVASWPAVLVGIFGAIALSVIGALVCELLDVPTVIGGLAGVWTGLLTAVVMATRRHSLSVARLFVAPKGAKAWWAAIGTGVGGGIVIRIASAVAGYPLVHWVQEESRTRAPIDGLDVSKPAAAVFAALAICVGAPLLEELFFRGVLLPTLARRLPVQWAMVVQALIFASLHLSLGIGVATAGFTLVVIGVAGYGLAFLRVHTTSLVPSIVAHASFNAVALVVILARVS